jgi:hypothetical protein
MCFEFACVLYDRALTHTQCQQVFDVRDPLWLGVVSLEQLGSMSSAYQTILHTGSHCLEVMSTLFGLHTIVTFLPSDVASIVEQLAHSRYSNWPYKLLGQTSAADEDQQTIEEAAADEDQQTIEEAAADEDQQTIEEAFFAECPCCLDSWFSEPLRAKSTGPEDLRSSEMMLLRQRLAYDLAPATNMMLEGFLSEIKASIPKSGKRAPNAEKVAWLSHLSLLMKQHIAAGRHDSRGQEPRSTLIERGTPLEHQHVGLPARPFTRWRNITLARWKCQNPSASPAEVQLELERLSAMWSNEFTEAQRLAAISALDVTAAMFELPEDHPDDRADDDDAMGDDPMLVSDWWDGGDSSWPLRPDLLLDFLHGHSSSGSTGVAGIAAKASRVRDTERHTLIVKDEHDISDDKMYSHRHSCSELHPGLCAHRDGDVYTDSLALAANMERALDDRFKHSFIAFVDKNDKDIAILTSLVLVMPA